MVCSPLPNTSGPLVKWSAFPTEDSSSNRAEVCSFYYLGKLLDKTENKEKDAADCLFKNH